MRAKRTPEQAEHHKIYMQEYYKREGNLGKRKQQRKAIYADLTPEERTAQAKKCKKPAPERLAITTKKYMLNHAYGLSLEQYAKMKEEQGNKCSICSRELVERGKDKKVPVYLCVDHNHTTGKVRGLLCSNCNAGVGMFEEDKSRMTRAIEYLREHEVV